MVDVFTSPGAFNSGWLTWSIMKTENKKLNLNLVENYLGRAVSAALEDLVVTIRC